MKLKFGFFVQKIVLADSDELAALSWWSLGDEEVDECLDVLDVDDLAELAEVWDVRALLIDELPKVWNCVLLKLVLSPLEEVLADVACDSVLIGDWDAGTLEHNCLCAELKSLADLEVLKTLFEPLHDCWDVGLDESNAKVAVWGWELCADLGDSLDDISFDLCVNHLLLDSLDQFDAEVAKEAILTSC